MGSFSKKVRSYGDITNLMARKLKSESYNLEEMFVPVDRTFDRSSRRVL